MPPDRLVIVALGAAGKGDAGAGGSQHLRVGAAAGGDKFPAIDHRSRQGAMTDDRSGARTPGGAGGGFEQLADIVADKFEGVAAFDQSHALGDQAFELDRFDFGAVLFGLAAALRLFVVIEFAFDAVELAVEQIDKRP